MLFVDRQVKRSGPDEETHRPDSSLPTTRPTLSQRTFYQWQGLVRLISMRTRCGESVAIPGRFSRMPHQPVSPSAPPYDMPQRYRLYGTTTASALSFTSNVPTTSGPYTLWVEEASPIPPSFWSDMRKVDSPAPTDAVPGTIYRHPAGNCHAFRFPEVADYIFTSDTISYALHDPDLRYALEIWLLGPVLSLWHELQGRPALHTAAVTVEGEAVAFLAANEGGKSTLAAALMDANCPLLTDDVLVLDGSGENVVGRPSYPQMRLWPEQIRRFLGPEVQVPQVTPNTEKCRVPVGPSGFGTFQDTARPVTHLFLPERHPHATSVQLSSLPPQEALITLVRHSFLPNTVEALGLGPERFPVLTTLVEQAQVHRLLYPPGMEHLPRVTDVVREAVS